MVMRLLLAVLAGAMLLAACEGTVDDAAPSPSSSPSAPGPAARLDFAAAETIASGLEVPWALAFVDDRTILVTERPGRVRVIEDGVLRDAPVLTLDVRSDGEAGLMGIALHPDYPEQPFAYVAATTSGGNRVLRFRLDDALNFANERVILDGLPAAQFHDGGRIAFGPDGMLYVAVGDAQEPERAAQRGALNGSILRVRPNGRVPDDNPFEASEVYSYGHRNPQGLAWSSDGSMYASEHGPTGEFDLCCHDEINLIEAGGYYGWPFRAGRARAMPGTPPAPARPPLAESGEGTWAPAGIAVYEPEGSAATLLVANLRGEQLLRFPIENGSLGLASAVMEEHGRLRAVAFGPDGCLYVTTSNRDGRGTPRDGDDRVLRVCPVE